MTIVQDEFERISAPSVVSEFERMVRDDIVAWSNKNGMGSYRLKAQAAAYWNERLN